MKNKNRTPTTIFVNMTPDGWNTSNCLAAIILHVYKKLCSFLPLVPVSAGVSDEEDQKPVRLPLKVAVELQPRSNHSWARVQSLAYNPRLR